MECLKTSGISLNKNTYIKIKSERKNNFQIREIE